MREQNGAMPVPNAPAAGTVSLKTHDLSLEERTSLTGAEGVRVQGARILCKIPVTTRDRGNKCNLN